MAARGSETDPGPRSLAGPASPSAGQRALPGTAQADDSPPGVWEEEAATCAATRSDGQNHHVGGPRVRRGCCVRLQSTSLRAGSGMPPGHRPSPSPVPGPRSGALPSLLVVRRHASAFCPSQLRRLTRTTADTSCVPCATRARACARRCPACRPALSPSALTTGGRVRARFRLRHAGPESVPAAQRPPEPPQRRPSPSSLGPQRSPSTTPAPPPLWPCPSAVPPLVAARHPQRPA